MQVKIPAVYMRGGSSKAVFFHENHLPQDIVTRERVILAAFGSPDPSRRQVDGMGGAISSTSKVAVISPSKEPGIDINYLFGQVSIDRPDIDYKGNCGNISSAVGPFAIEEGLVQAVEPITEVTFYQVNTKKIIKARVPVEKGYPKVEGDFAIGGVPGTGAKIEMHFSKPGGSVTGSLLPTGNVKDKVLIDGNKEVTVSIVDASNPIVFVPAGELDLDGMEMEAIEKDHDIKSRLEEIRSRAAVMIGIASDLKEATERSQAVPKVAVVSEPKSYRVVNGRNISIEDIDLFGWLVSMNNLHMAYPLTGVVCTAGAAKIDGTVVSDLVSPEARSKEIIHLGHPSGIISVKAIIEKRAGSYEYDYAEVGRTARRLMEGYVCVPQKHISGGRSDA